MIDKIKELKGLGYDISSIIENTKKLNHKYKELYGEDAVPPKWTRRDIVHFSNTVYNIVTKEK